VHHTLQEIQRIELAGVPGDAEAGGHAEQGQQDQGEWTWGWPDVSLIGACESVPVAFIR
jgi:hypothetical protein